MNRANVPHPISLDYALPGNQPAINHVPLVVCTVVVLSCVCLFTLIRIELSNNAAGGVLPKVESGKWRVSYIVSEKAWREFQANRFEGDPSLLIRPLTPNERANMVQETARTATFETS